MRHTLTTAALAIALAMPSCTRGTPDAGDSAAAPASSPETGAPVAAPGMPPGELAVATHRADPYLIDPAGMGPVRLGQSLAEARRQLPRAAFIRESDGEGAVYVDITIAPDTGVIVYAGEDAAADSIDWPAKIEYIESFGPPFRTPEGVTAGALVADVEEIYGPVKVIILSEIEARQFVRFERQPAHLTFRLDYSGLFDGDARTTTKYAPGAKIFSIAVH